MILDAQRLRQVTAVLGAVTGLPYVAREQRLEAAAAWVVWDADVHVCYVLSVAPAGWQKFAVSAGIRRGAEPVEARLERTLTPTQVDRLLRDPHGLVGILVGQRRWTG